MLPTLSLYEHAAEIWLNRPLVANKITTDDLFELRRHLKTVDELPHVLVLTIRSAGKHFCSGFDVTEVAAKSQVEGSSFGEMVDALEACRAVTIAAVHSGVYGGATDMVLACDFRIGCEDTNMFMPAARLGLHYYLSGMQRYVSRLGLDTAKRLFLTAEKLDAQSMKDCGFLTQLVAREDLDKELRQLVDMLSAMAPLPLLGMKKHLNRIAAGTVQKEEVAAEVHRTLTSADLAEGGLAWKQKRKPVFVGR